MKNGEKEDRREMLEANVGINDAAAIPQSPSQDACGTQSTSWDP
jgi:hypothetical protein